MSGKTDTAIAVKTTKKSAPKMTVAQLVTILGEALIAINEGVALHPIEAEKMRERIALLLDTGKPEEEPSSSTEG